MFVLSFSIGTKKNVHDVFTTVHQLFYVFSALNYNRLDHTHTTKEIANVFISVFRHNTKAGRDGFSAESHW